MKNRYIKSLFSSCLSILPMVAIILILSISKIAILQKNDYISLALGTVAMIVGLAVFQIGVTQGLTKVGEYMGSSLSKQKKLFIVIIFSITLGTLITCAEPSILIVASQVNINKYVLIITIALGVGIFVALGVIRIIYGRSLKAWYITFYFIVFAIICLLQVKGKNQQFLPFIFDAGGITTGSATVPFILALGAGVAAVRGGKKSSEESFGLVGLASIGPIISMAVLVIANNQGFLDYVIKDATSTDPFKRFLYALIYTGPTSMGSLIDVALALSPILVIFFIYNFMFIKLSGNTIKKILIGFGFSYIGLVFFLTGVSAAMTPIGFEIGIQLAQIENGWIIFIAFIIGLLTILCEPAVQVLTTQIENISNGKIKKSTVLITLSLGVGVAICLAVIRTVYNFSIMYYLIPGYTISLILMFICPNIFTAIAFDSGGTASGPMSVSFVVPMIVGITSYKDGLTPIQYAKFIAEGGDSSKYWLITTKSGQDFYCLGKGGEFYQQSFGAVALIALTPIIAIQILGAIITLKNYRRLKVMRELKHDPSNGAIINFGE